MKGSNRITRAIAGVTLALMLAACTSYKKANRENFTRALNGYFATHDDCLYPSAIRFPYGTSTTSKTPDFDALTSAGLLERNEEKDIKIKRYTLTAFAAQHVSGRFCYGHRQVTNIDGFTAPATQSGQQTTQVQYHYQIVDLPGWADSDQMRAAFPALAKANGNQAEDTAKLVLTVNGWRVPE